MRLGLFIIIWLLWCLPSEAACSGSGSTRLCATNSTAAQIGSAIVAVGGGGTVTLAAGTFNSLGAAIEIAGGIPVDGFHLVCATIATTMTRDCTLNRSGDVIYSDTISATVTGVVEIAGINFTGSTNSGKLWIFGNQDIQQLHIHHNTFNQIGFGAIALLMGEGSATGHFYGAVHHNAFISTAGNFAAIEFEAGQTWRIGLQGSSNNLFFEDNIVTMSGTYNNGQGCLDGKLGAGFVVRFNTFTGCRILSHGVMHGGPPSWEAYGNIIQSVPDNFRLIHHQGSGEWKVFGNRMVGSTFITLQHYRSSSNPNDAGTSESCNGVLTTHPDGSRSPTATYRGWPCWRQPGRDNNATLRPVYMWDNLGGGVNASVDISGYGDEQFLANHMQQNRDWYTSGLVQTSPSIPNNGTSGVGFGTLANRPTSCTVTPESLDAGNGGVAYAATNGTWMLSTPSQGFTTMPAYILYRCFSTTPGNQWILEYTPYTYPHPLQSGGTPPDITPPAAPTNLRFAEVSP